MNFARRYWWLILLLIVIIGALAWRGRKPAEPGGPSAPGDPAAPAVSTRLEIEAFGGFAYVRSASDNQLEVAFLKNVNVPGCKVTQLGVKLMVAEGTIVSGTAPPGNRFDIATTVVSFPALASSTEPLTATRGARPPDRPGNPASTTEWEDFKWVPALNKEVGASLNPNWRTMVDGRLIVKGGTIKGLQPSLPGVRNRVFLFRNKDSSKTFTQAITDMTNYVVRVPAAQIVMRLQRPTGPPEDITIAPINPGRPVKLRVMGDHDMSGEIKDGEPVHDYCSFYQLMQPIPDEKDWLIPHLVALPTATPGGGGSPSPGRFCPGIDFAP